MVARNHIPTAYATVCVVKHSHALRWPRSGPRRMQPERPGRRPSRLREAYTVFRRLSGRVGTARSLSSGRASRGPVGTLAYPSLAVGPRRVTGCRPCCHSAREPRYVRYAAGTRIDSDRRRRSGPSHCCDAGLVRSRPMRMPAQRPTTRWSKQSRFRGAQIGAVSWIASLMHDCRMPPPRIVYNSRHYLGKDRRHHAAARQRSFSASIINNPISIADDLIGVGRHWRVQAG